MARCGCSGECNCVMIGSDCIAVTGTGNPGTPYTPALIVDPAADNQLACNVGAGAYVPPASVDVADTDCIALTGTGFPGDPITADPILDDDPCNLLTCGAGSTPGGLLAEVYTDDTNCISLSGCGTFADPLIPTVIFSPDGGNIAECRGNGLYVPAASVGTITTYAEMFFNDGDHEFGADVNLTGGILPFNGVSYDVGVGITDPGGDGFLIPGGGGGWYFIEYQLHDGASTASFSKGGETDGFIAQSNILINGGIVTYDAWERYSDFGHFTMRSSLEQLADGDTVQIQAYLFNDTGGAVGPWHFDGAYNFVRLVKIGD